MRFENSEKNGSIDCGNRMSFVLQIELKMLNLCMDFGLHYVTNSLH